MGSGATKPQPCKFFKSKLKKNPLDVINALGERK